jgi:hypothetical protein
MSTDKILNIVNGLAKETIALNEEELVRLFEYLIDKDTNKSDVEKFLTSCPSNNAKLSFLRALLKKSRTGMFLYPLSYLYLCCLLYPKTLSRYCRGTRFW